MPADGARVPSRSISGLFEVERFPASVETGARGAADRGARLLIEVPHGATTAAHFDALRRRLRGDYPDDLREFYFVNTDVGAPETAREIARRVASGTSGAPAMEACLLRCLLPRTFIDVNRVLAAGAPDYRATGLTPGLPDWITDEADRALLCELHAAYQTASREAFDAVCGAGGIALTLHTYAPRSVEIESVDRGIAAALRQAYRPERYEQWPRRPAVEIIDSTPHDECLASSSLIAAVTGAYATLGIAVERNRTYRLDPATGGHAHSIRHPGRVLCVEINRELLADPFDPFVEMQISPAKATRMAAPLALALAGELAAS